MSIEPLSYEQYIKFGFDKEMSYDEYLKKFYEHARYQ